jgi:hypothetical protein
MLIGFIFNLLNGNMDNQYQQPNHTLYKLKKL